MADWKNDSAENEMRKAEAEKMAKSRAERANAPKFGNRENKCYKVDGKDVWESRSVAVVGMILMTHLGDMYILAGKRGKALPNEVGKWCMPCGFLDWDETMEEAVRREIWEETGIDIEKLMHTHNKTAGNMDFPWRNHSDPSTSSPAQNVSMHYAVHLNTVPNIQHEDEVLPEATWVNNDDLNEVDDVKWIQLDDIDQFDWAFNHDSIIRIFVNTLED